LEADDVRNRVAQQIVKQKQQKVKKEPPIRNLIVAENHGPRVVFRGREFKLGGTTYCDEVREYAPSKRTLLFVTPRSKAKVQPSYFVNFPYVIFVRKKNELLMAIAKHPIQSDNDVVYFPTVGNVYANMKVCLANSAMRGAPNFSFDLMVEYFWSSPADLNGNWTGRKAIAENFGSCGEWEKMDVEEVLDRIEYRPIHLRKLVGLDRRQNNKYN